jgi:allantoin racemase
MRLLLLNANTSEFVTGKVAAAARATASPGTEIVAVTGAFGARVIATRTEMAIAEHAAVQLMAQHGAGCDAVVVAVSWDTGVRAGRELLGVPVVGITEAALVTASQLGGRFGFVSFDARSRALYEELVAGYGHARRGGVWRVVDSRAAFAPGDTAALEERIVAAVEAMVVEDGVEVAILTGAVMAGVARRLQPRARVPLLDGVTCAVLQAEALVRLGAGRPRAGSYASPGPREVVGLDPALAARFGPDAPPRP